jgi:hypothetical protein
VGVRRPIVVGEWSAPAHLSWVAGVGPVEPDTEVADHVRVYDGDGWVGCPRRLDSFSLLSAAMSCLTSARSPATRSRSSACCVACRVCVAVRRRARPASGCIAICGSARSSAPWWRRGWCRSGRASGSRPIRVMRAGLPAFTRAGCCSRSTCPQRAGGGARSRPRPRGRA